MDSFLSIGSDSPRRGLATLALLLSIGTNAVWGQSSTRQAPGSTPPPPMIAPRVVVELFTSEGCSSCPPADQNLSRLGARSGVLGLSHHVDYWNYLGWRDPFSSKEATRRQHTYASWFDSTRVYTPQMVVQGQTEFVGSRAGDAQDAIARATRSLPDLKLSVIRWQATPERFQGAVSFVAGPGVDPSGHAVLAMVRQSDVAEQVTRGENSGRRLAHDFVVRRVTPIGRTPSDPGGALTFDLPLEPSWDARALDLALVLQDTRNGRILCGFLLEP